MPRALRPVFALLFLLAICVTCTIDLCAQAPTTAISRNLDRKLRRDAARLALRLNYGEDLRYQSIRIPSSEMESLYRALVAMHNADENIRSIFRCNVHTRPNPSIDHMLVIFDRNSDWAAPLRAGRHETTSITLNDLLYEHDLIIEKHMQWTGTEDAISIRSKNPLNMAALANDFHEIEGVKEVDLGLSKEMGSDITATRIRTGWRFVFTLSFGSLQEKGEKTHTWQYEYSDAGKLTKVNETGDPVPEWMRCAVEPLALAPIAR